jgi:hypothetical protein
MMFDLFNFIAGFFSVTTAAAFTDPTRPQFGR